MPYDTLCRFAVAAVVALPVVAVAEVGTMVDAGEPYGKLKLIDEVDAAAVTHDFVEAPGGASRVTTVLDRSARVMPNEGEPRYFAYRLGAGKGLVAGRAYLLQVDYPEDVARTIFIANRGCETARAFHTGRSLGDVLYTYTDNNAESIDVPLVGQWRTWSMLFHLHPRYAELNLPRNPEVRPGRPENGFLVIVTQPQAISDPASAGAAIGRIRLFEVDDPRKLDVALQLPKGNLPRRHLFWREEMSDGVIGKGTPDQRGFDRDIEWYDHKLQLMRFLGMNTFSKDLLEFGHNQGWDAEPYGGNDWYWASHSPNRWRDILTLIREKYPDITVLPYYEWSGGAGAKGLGKEKRARPLSGQDTYTHIKWSEIMNVDVTDPAALDDATKLLDATILRYKNDVSFVGAWFRTRPSMMPISFADATLERFAKDARVRVSRDQLKSDDTLRQRYYDWWFAQRKTFLIALRDHLRKGGIKDADIIFTPDSSEPGVSLDVLRSGKVVVTDDVAAWQKMLAQPGHQRVTPVNIADVIRGENHLASTLAMRGTWGQWEWHHSIPPADPQNFKKTEGILMTLSINRAYTVATPKAFEAFRVPAGLAAIRHYPLNETTMHPDLGYFVCDVERTGAHVMLPEVRAMAYGDPTHIGYLAAASFQRGFPQYVRQFNAAFVSLPALPSVVVPGAASHKDVVVRRINTPAPGSGTYLAVVHTGLRDAGNVTVKLPVRGRVFDAATGKPLQPQGQSLQLTMGPCELRAIRIQP